MPTVIRTVHILRRHIRHIGIFRINENLAHVPEAGDAPVFRGFFPACSPIVGTIESALFFLGLHNQVNALPMISGRGRNTGPAPISRGKTVASDLRPRDAFIG